jgi:hypothetical protein
MYCSRSTLGMKQERTEDITCHHYTYTSRLHFISRALPCSIPFSILLFLEAGVTISRSSDNAFSFHPGLNFKVNQNPTQHPKPRQHPKSTNSRLGRGHEALRRPCGGYQMSPLAVERG